VSIRRESAGVITFRIGDFGFRIENIKTKLKNHMRIPQSAFPNPQSSGGALQNIKSQGVGCQVSGKRNVEAET
jgi:hypothetical protein